MTFHPFFSPFFFLLHYLHNKCHGLVERHCTVHQDTCILLAQALADTDPEQVFNTYLSILFIQDQVDLCHC